MRRQPCCIAFGTSVRSAWSQPVHLALQTKDKWGFQMTSRYEMYSNFFNKYTQPDFKPQIVSDPSL